MTTAIDLFAGIGGWSQAMHDLGGRVLWAANHNPIAVEYHALNHPETEHACQDLHQARWSEVPSHDVLLASPCCQGHSRARGKGYGNPEHDESRSTAWAVVSALEVHRPDLALVENVPEFSEWVLYPSWRDALHRLGYSVAEHIVNLAHLGGPQSRRRLILVLTRSLAPLRLKLPRRLPTPAADLIRWAEGYWKPWCPWTRRRPMNGATMNQIYAGRVEHGRRFLVPYYGSNRAAGTTRSLDRPIGTIPTHDRYGVVDGDYYRMLTVEEARAAMTFPDSTILPTNKRDAMRLLGNAVPPLMGREVLRAALEAA